jgi:hypothetical protein
MSQVNGVAMSAELLSELSTGRVIHPAPEIRLTETLDDAQ